MSCIYVLGNRADNVRRIKEKNVVGVRGYREGIQILLNDNSSKTLGRNVISVFRSLPFEGNTSNIQWLHDKFCMCLEADNFFTVVYLAPEAQ